jgi:ubiquinone biosynthesis protein
MGRARVAGARRARAKRPAGGARKRPARAKPDAARGPEHPAWRLPGLAFGALRHGILPSGLAAARTLRREGRAELHWKVLGDGLVRFLRHAGPLFTKLGQVLATRTDLLPEALCLRLESLYSEQPAMPPRELERTLRRAWGRRLPFRDFDRAPIAVGSVGQVHRARLADGAVAIVKVLRPGVRESIERDLALARSLLELWLGLPGRAHPGAGALLARALDDLGEACAREADLAQEADALREFARRFEKHPHVRVPRCFDALCSEHVLVMEELRGEPLAAWRRRARHEPEAARRIANLALGEILRQIFEDGRFHADPHAGNLLLLEDGRLGIVDLGLTGELAREDRRRIARAVRAFLARDADGLIAALLGFGTTPPDFAPEKFKEDVRKLVRTHGPRLAERLRGRAGGGAAEESSSLEAFVSALFALAHRHGIHVPPATTLLIKSLVTIEGVARSLHPELDLATAAVPVVLRSLAPGWLQRLLGARV